METGKEMDASVISKKYLSAPTVFVEMILSFLGKAIRPPYSSLPCLIWAAVIFSYLFNPKALYLQGRFYDTDDYMRFVQVFRWLDNPAGLLASWYDLREPRLNPPDGVVMHWSRLVDLPLALVQGFFETFLERLQAAQLTALIVPAGLMLALFYLARCMARPFLPAQKAALTALILPTLTAIIFNFSPGRVDHHAHQILAAGFLCATLPRMLLTPTAFGWPLAAGLIAALSLWVGAEGFVGLGLFVITLSFLCAMRGQSLVRPALIFGGTFLVGSICVLFIARPPAEWAAVDYDYFSLFFVAIAALVALHLLGLSLLADFPRLVRFIGGGLLALLLLGGLLGLFPDFIKGPYAKVNPIFAAIFFPSIGEAKPLAESLALWPKTWLLVFMTVWPVFLAVLTCLGMAIRHPRHRLLWLILGFYSLAPFLLAVFWERRLLAMSECFLIVPLTVLLLTLWHKAAALYQGRRLFVLELLIFLLVGIGAKVVLPALVADKPVVSGLLLYPPQTSTSMCDTRRVTDLLSDDPYLDRPRLILSSMNDGPELLYGTPHHVLSAPYHRNAAGNLKGLQILRESDMLKAKIAVQTAGIDLVLACAANSALYEAPNTKGKSSSGAILTLRIDGTVQTELPPNASLMQRLVAGKAPDWLRPVPIPYETSYKLYEVVPKP
jgi:hypothetical protein